MILIQKAERHRRTVGAERVSLNLLTKQSPKGPRPHKKRTHTRMSADIRVHEHKQVTVQVHQAGALIQGTSSMQV